MTSPIQPQLVCQSLWARLSVVTVVVLGLGATSLCAGAEDAPPPKLDAAGNANDDGVVQPKPPVDPKSGANSKPTTGTDAPKGSASKVGSVTDEGEVPAAQTATTVDLVILTNAPPIWSEKNLREFLLDAVRDSGCTCDEKGLLVRQIAWRDYDLLSKLISPGRLQKPQAGDGRIEQDRDRAQFWQLVIPDGNRLPRGIVVRYDNLATLKTDEEEAFPLAPVKELAARFRFYKPGLALFRTEDAWDMKEYALRYGEEPASDLEFHPWPSGPRQFFIQIPDFAQGIDGRRRLFEKMESGKLGEVLINESKEKPVTFAHADFVSPTVEPDTDVWTGTAYTVRFKALPGETLDAATGTGVARVWMLFPLTSLEKDEMLARLKKADRDQTRGGLADLIRESQLGYKALLGDAGGNIAPVAKLPKDLPQPTAELEADGQPTWYEIPATNDARDYARTFQIRDLQGWKNRPERLGETWRIYAYESQFPQGGQMVRRIKFVTRGNESGLWINEKVQDWPARMKQLIDLMPAQ